MLVHFCALPEPQETGVKKPPEVFLPVTLGCSPSLPFPKGYSEKPLPLEISRHELDTSLPDTGNPTFSGDAYHQHHS